MIIEFSVSGWVNVQQEDIPESEVIRSAKEFFALSERQQESYGCVDGMYVPMPGYACINGWRGLRIVSK